MSNIYNGHIFHVASDKRFGGEVWAQFDDSASVFELFASDEGNDYLGCCDTLDECRQFAADRFEQGE